MKEHSDAHVVLITGALTGIGRAMALAFAHEGAWVVASGPIDTELSPADGPRADVLKKLTSVGRYGKVEEIASAVSFLANPEQAFINGESLMVDGGWNA